MTGPEHYHEAERMLAMVATTESYEVTRRAELVGRAQVHATLALAAATALGHSRHVSDGRVSQGMPTGDSEAWQQVAGVQLS